MGDKSVVTYDLGTEKAPPMLPNTYDQRAATLDYVNGVFCAEEKLWNATSQEILCCHCRVDGNAINQGEATIFRPLLICTLTFQMQQVKIVSCKMRVFLQGSSLCSAKLSAVVTCRTIALQNVC